jgi:8-amino-7-oxononanoate synthase
MTPSILPHIRELLMSLQTSESPATAVVESVLAEVRKALPHGTDIQLTLDTPLAEAGLDSLARMDVVNCLETTFRIRFTEDSLYYLDTCRDLVELVIARTEFPERPLAARLKPAVAPASITDDGSIPIGDYTLEQFVECQLLSARIAGTAAAGISNPFFRVKQKVNSATACIANREVTSYTSFDYLGLARDPRVAAAAKAAIDAFGTSASASRLVGGNNPVIEELDATLAVFLGAEAAVSLPSGYGANASALGHIVGPDDLVLYDELAHNSIVQGAKLSQAAQRPFPHNDFDFVDRFLADARSEHRRVVIAVEGVYSMDGDYLDLPRLLEVKRRHCAIMYVDEAHSLGVLGRHGRGIFEHFGIDPAAGDLRMGTISKALASGGGFLAGPKQFIEYLKYTLPANVFATALSPANAAAALTALNILQAESDRVARLAQRAQLFLALAQEQGWDTGPSGGTPIIPIMIGDSLKSLTLSATLLERGIDVQPILYPAVPESKSRLRFFITAAHTEQQIRETITALAECLEVQTVSR